MHKARKLEVMKRIGLKIAILAIVAAAVPAWVVDRGRTADDRLHRAGEFGRVRLGGAQLLLRPDDPRRRDQLLRAGDLGDGLDRTDPPPDQAKLGSHGLLLLGVLVLGVLALDALGDLFLVLVLERLGLLVFPAEQLAGTGLEPLAEVLDRVL